MYMHGGWRIIISMSQLYQDPSTDAIQHGHHYTASVDTAPRSRTHITINVPHVPLTLPPCGPKGPGQGRPPSRVLLQLRDHLHLRRHRLLPPRQLPLVGLQPLPHLRNIGPVP